MINQMGVPFYLKEDWRALFQKDSWFLWQRPSDRLETVWKRFTVWNLLRWYFYQAVVRLIVGVLYPILLLAYKYWNDVEEGEQTKIVSGLLLKSWPRIKFFKADLTTPKVKEDRI